MPFNVIKDAFIFCSFFFGDAYSSCEGGKVRFLVPYMVSGSDIQRH